MRTLLSLAIVFVAMTGGAHAGEKEGWISMFDGKTLKGWKTNENPDSFKVDDGAIVAYGPRSHLFYVGQEEPFVNFEFEAEVLTKPGSNAGIYFHTRYQEEGWPKFGFEAQVNNSYAKDPIKTGSLYQVKNVTEPPAKDDEWFKYSIRVEGKRIVVKVNDKVTVDYTEPADAKAGEQFTRVLDKGTFALQAHDPMSEVRFRNLRVRRLP